MDVGKERDTDSGSHQQRRVRILALNSAVPLLIVKVQGGANGSPSAKI